MTTPTTTTSPTVRLDVDDHVATITLNRPERMNALVGSMRDELHRAVSEAAADDAIRVMVIRGAGRAFCAGADVNAMAEIVERGNEESFAAFMRSGMRVIRDIRAAPKPVIAALNGPAVGAGASLALACDLRIASDTATVGFTFTRIGLHPDWGATYNLPRLVGDGRAAELLLSGRMVEATEAERIGLVQHVIPAARFDEAVRRLAADLVGGPPLALRALKATLTGAGDDALTNAMETEARAQLRLFRSADLREGIAAFREKRAPTFRAE